MPIRTSSDHGSFVDCNHAVLTTHKIASKPRATLQVGKQAFYQQVEMPFNAAYDLASQVMSLNMLGPEAEEGIGAF
ncbi:hypothetical protein [Aquidulcibacter sp.]|uniref:hypothetical protein n=1 Tax=Aquidulcibacter sp. TaxID=2052990 RepID=UPI0028A93862|nr:hypothetical protein [Aquidulcibacter sp.]